MNEDKEINHLLAGEKITSEKDFRKAIINQARYLGCDIEVKQIFDKYDNLIKHCYREDEKKHIARLGILELHKYFGCRGGLSINGIEIIPPEEPEKQEENSLITIK